MLLILPLVACAPPGAATNPGRDAPIIRYLALGDSYTIGQGVPLRDSFPHQLAERLTEHGVTARTTVIALTGWTVDDLLLAVQARALDRSYDLVTVLIGVNDQFRGYPVAGYRQDFRFILGAAIECAAGRPRRVIVLSIPDWGVTPFAAGEPRGEIAAMIDAYNEVNRQEAGEAGARYVDLTRISRRAGSDRALITYDGLHPSATMYQEWTVLMLPQALEALGLTE